MGPVRVQEPEVATGPDGTAEVVWLRLRKASGKKIGAAQIDAENDIVGRQKLAGDGIRLKISDLRAASDSQGRVRLTFFTQSRFSERGREGLFTLWSAAE